MVPPVSSSSRSCGSRRDSQIWREAADPMDAGADIFRALHRGVQDIADGKKRWGRWSYDPKGGYLVLDDGAPNEYSIPLASCTTEAGRLNWLAQIAEKNWSADV